MMNNVASSATADLQVAMELVEDVSRGALIKAGELLHGGSRCRLEHIQRYLQLVDAVRVAHLHVRGLEELLHPSLKTLPFQCSDLPLQLPELGQVSLDRPLTL